MTATVLSDLDEDALDFATTLADFLAKRIDHSVLTGIDEGQGIFPEGLWSELVGLGCLQVAAEPNGASLSAAVLAELGFAGLPSPLMTSLLAVLVARTVGAESDQLVEIVLNGGVITTILPTRPEVCGVVLDSSDEKLTLTGGPCIAEWVEDAQEFLILCGDGSSGWSLVAVAPDQVGVSTSPVRGIDHDRIYLVSFDETPVARVVVAGLSETDFFMIGSLTLLLRAAVLSGVSARALNMTSEYVTQRVQFGKALSHMQATRQSIGNMVTDTVAMAAMVTQAATGVDAGSPYAERYCRLAAIFTAEAGERVLSDSSQLHGGIGFIIEHVLHFFYRLNKGQQLRMGGIEQQLEIASDRILPAMMTGQWDWLAFNNFSPRFENGVEHDV